MKDSRTAAEISAALSRLAAEDAAASPPPELESRLLAEFKAPSTGSRKRSPFWALAMAAPFALALVVLHRGGSDSQAGDEPFYQIPYVAPAAPYERTEVRRELVPVAALIAAGLEVHVADSGGVVNADVLFGQDGRALAIRLVTGSGPANTRRIDQ